MCTAALGVVGVPLPLRTEALAWSISINPQELKPWWGRGWLCVTPTSPPGAPQSPLTDQPCVGRLISSCPSTLLSALFTHKVGGGVGGLPSLAQLSFLDNPPPPPPASPGSWEPGHLLSS